MESSDIEDSSKSEILTLSEIAYYLKVSEKTILRMVKRGELPGSKIASQWRFQRVAIEQWLTAKMDSAPADRLVDVIQTTSTIIPLAKLITPNRIIMDLEAGDRTFVLQQLIQPLADGNLLDNPDQFLRSLNEREEMGSTGIGYGVAIPHVREQENSGVRQTCVVMGICKEGVDFDALDGEPTYVFMLLCGNSVTIHLRLLAKTMLMLRTPGMLDSLRRCKDCEDVETLLRKSDFNLSIQF
jgi:nitrogen PTS system EIIA component